jgi:dipeptidyl aminopeptidase/acylaminoacyl peptidase
MKVSTKPEQDHKADIEIDVIFLVGYENQLYPTKANLSFLLYWRKNQKLRRTISMSSVNGRQSHILYFLLLTVFASVQLAYAQSNSLSLEEIVSLKRVTEVHMSPKGDQIAYLLSVPREIYKDDDGKPYHELHVVDFDGVSRPYVSGKIDVSSAAWSADGQSIYFVAMRDPDEKLNSLFQIVLTGGEAVQKFTHKSSIGAIYPSPDGKRIAFLATEAEPEKTEDLAAKGFKAVVYEESVLPTKVWMFDLATGEAVAQDLTGSASDFSWSSDGSRYAVALAPTPLIDDSYTSRDIYVVNTLGGNVLNSMGSVGKLGHFEFSPDGERIAYIGSIDINDPNQGRLYLASSTGGERRDLVPEYLGHIGAIAWQDDINIRWLGQRGVWTEWSVASTMAAREAGPAPASGPILRSIDARPGQSVVAAIADTSQHPPEVFLLRDGAAPKRLTDSNPILSQRKLARQEAITYPARDGLPLEAILIHPEKEVRGGNPLVIFVHGGPEAHQSNGWMSSYSQPGQLLAAEGYAVVYPNYRGSTGRGSEFSRLGQNDYADEEFNDIVDVKSHLVSKGMVNADRVGISGGSYGGYATMWSATALSEEYAAGVAFVGISNQTSKFGTGDIPYEMYNVHSRAWPWEDWLGMLQRSPIYHADKAKTPLLIMGGDKDPRVHPGQSLEMYRNIKLRTDTPVRLVIYPGEVHGNRNTAARYDYALRFKRWMDHYLKGPGGEPPPYEIDHAARLEQNSE